MKLPALNLRLPALPKRVAIASAIIAGVLVVFAILFPLLGGGRDTSLSENTRLKAQVSQLNREIQQAKADYEFVVENQEGYEALIGGDRLIPHTRRTAIRHMQSVALQRGLTTMSYSFQAAGSLSAVTAANQPQTGDYSVSVETIELTLGAPLDGQIFGFLHQIVAGFPGSAIIQSVSISRAGRITTDALNKVSRGEESGLVNGTARLLWRTAIQNKETGQGEGAR